MIVLKVVQRSSANFSSEMDLSKGCFGGGICCIGGAYWICDFLPLDLFTERKMIIIRKITTPIDIAEYRIIFCIVGFDEALFGSVPAEIS